MTARQIKRHRVRNMTSRLNWLAWVFGRDGVLLLVVPLSVRCVVHGIEVARPRESFAQNEALFVNYELSAVGQ